MRLKTVSYPQNGIYRMEVNCRLFRIRVVEATGDDIEFSWKDTTMRSLEIREESGKLTLQDHAAVGIYGTLALINLKAESQLLIKLPAGFAGKVSFQSKEENLHISNLHTDAVVGMATSTGEILLENVSCRRLDIRGYAGKVKCYSVDAAESIHISTRNGAVNCQLFGNEEDYKVSCSTGYPRCECNGVTGNGRKKVLLESERGRVQFSFLNGMNIGRYDRDDAFRDW